MGWNHQPVAIFEVERPQFVQENCKQDAWCLGKGFFDWRPKGCCCGGCCCCCLLFVVCCLLSVVCCLLFVVCCLLFVVCCLLFVVCCLLVVGCWLLVVGCWLLVVGCWLLLLLLLLLLVLLLLLLLLLLLWWWWWFLWLWLCSFLCLWLLWRWGWWCWWSCCVAGVLVAVLSRVIVSMLNQTQVLSLYLKVKIDGTDTKRYVSLVNGQYKPICKDCANVQVLYIYKCRRILSWRFRYFTTWNFYAGSCTTREPVVSKVSRRFLGSAGATVSISHVLCFMCKTCCSWQKSCTCW